MLFHFLEGYYLAPDLPDPGFNLLICDYQSRLGGTNVEILHVDHLAEYLVLIGSVEFRATQSGILGFQLWSLLFKLHQEITGGDIVIFDSGDINIVALPGKTPILVASRSSETESASEDEDQNNNDVGPADFLGISQRSDNTLSPFSSGSTFTCHVDSLFQIKSATQCTCDIAAQSFIIFHTNSIVN